jgi:hypothetical protein
MANPRADKPSDTAAPGDATAGVTIDPSTNTLTLNPGQVLDETITVTIGFAVNNITLVPSPTIAPFVTSITPPAGYGPLPAGQHTLKFEVRFTGIPCKPEQQVVTGTIDVVADRKVIARKPTTITVPPCATEIVYAVKFVCGVQADCECACTSVQPGSYATEINIHNYSNKEVVIGKRFVPVVLAGAPAGREPHVAMPRAEDRIVLPPHAATMDDCCRIVERLLGAPVTGPLALTVGFVELTASADVAVTAVYTASGGKCGVSIDVEQIIGKRA